MCDVLLTFIVADSYRQSQNCWEYWLVCDWLPGNRVIGMATRMNRQASFSFMTVDSWCEMSPLHGVHTML